MPAKPDLEFLWAETGATSVPSDSKIQAGWIAEIPTHQMENWIQNRQDTFLAHINEEGIPVWDAVTTYEIGNIAKGSDDSLYVALTGTNQNNNPVSSPADWELLSEAFFSPSSDEKDALAGTDGTPSTANKFVTNSDGRVLTQDENDACVGTDGTPSSANKFVTDSDPRLPSTDEIIRAWVHIDASSGTPTIVDSFNVTSITDNGVGDFTINFTSALPSANYVLAGSSQDGGAPSADNRVAVIGPTRRIAAAFTTGSARVSIYAPFTDIAVDTPLVSLIFLGG